MDDERYAVIVPNLHILFAVLFVDETAWIVFQYAVRPRRQPATPACARRSPHDIHLIAQIFNDVERRPVPHLVYRFPAVPGFAEHLAVFYAVEFLCAS